MAVLAAVSMATPTLLAAAPAAATEASPPALSIPEPAPEPENLEPSAGQRGTSADDQAAPGTAASPQAPAAPEAGTSPAAPSAGAPAETTPGSAGPVPTGAPTTQPEAPGAVGTAAGEGTGSGTRPSSPATAPDGTIEPIGAAEAVTSARPAAGPARKSEEGPASTGELGETALSTTLHGLPSKVVPGSGWKKFTFRANNSSAKAIKSVDVYALLAAIDHRGRDRWHLLTLQWYDEAAGVWKTVDPDLGYLTTLAGLAPGEHTDITLRMKVQAAMPVGDGHAVALGRYLDQDDTHILSEAMGYDFDIVVEESEPPVTAEPGSKPHAPGNRSAPQGDLTQLSVTRDSAGAGTKSGPAGPATGQLDATDGWSGRADTGATLAETGGDAASGWMVGAGSASIALGAALAATARRRHRDTF